MYTRTAQASTTPQLGRTPTDATLEHLDVVIIGAGVSGIAAARELRTNFPDLSFTMLETHAGHGGTWWTHRYPGVRSDSDLYTYGYSFKPWLGNSIASSQEIQNYLGEVIAENDLGPTIRYEHKLLSAQWSSSEQRWTLTVQRTADGSTFTMSAGFLWACPGHYDHERGHTPEWRGFDTYKGTVVHPQHWPEDLDWSGKRVVVIGSGATAATLIPSLAAKAAHVTMLQRSPTFFIAEPREHPLEKQLRELDVPNAWTHEIMRRAYIARGSAVVRQSFENPQALRTMLIDQARALLPEGFDVDRHFNPSYRPWQQRIALVPDGDLFSAIASGKASLVTDAIECFDAKGIVLKSGERLDADIVVTATGFNLGLFGGVAFEVDGQPVHFPDRVTWRGLMIEGLPNMAYMLGYFRASWTLRVDLVTDVVRRIFQHMAANGLTTVTPHLRPEDADMPRLPWMDLKNFNAGYVQRSQHIMYRQGDRLPWRHLLEHEEERTALPAVEVDERALIYGTAPRAATSRRPALTRVA